MLMVNKDEYIIFNSIPSISW